MVLIDTRRLPDESRIDTDVCIVGGGPAGITLARALRDRAVSVCLVESGGLEADEQTQALADLPADAGDLRFPPGTRRRQLGGTANVWDVAIPGRREGVLLRPFDPIDFEEREWVPHSGWPLGYADLAPYYERAQCSLGLRPNAVDIAAWPDDGAPPWPLNEGRVRTVVDQYVHRGVLIERQVQDVVDAEAVQVLLWANAVELQGHRGGSAVEGVRVACLDGRHHTVRASVVVLGAGAIENARLLMVSGSDGGIGNERGLVGRFFMDHRWANLGSLRPSDPEWFAKSACYDIRRAGDFLASGRLQVSESIMRTEGLLNSGVRVMPHAPEQQERTVDALRYLASRGRRGQSSGYGDALLTALRRGPYSLSLTSELAWRQRRFPPTVSWGWAGLRDGGRRLPAFDLELQLELPPSPGNCIRLTEERDALGLPMVAIDYQLGELEHRTFARMRAIIADELKIAGIGEVDGSGVRSLSAYPDSLHHHMGTTRMHESPEYGVVDPNSRVHGLDNLYVAGSSVFPTGGFANPTLTLIALTLRLADHLVPPE